VSVTVIDWSPPAAGWTGRLGPVPGLLRHRIRRGRRDRVEAQVTLARPQPLYVALAALLDALAPHTTQPSPVSTDMAAYRGPPEWARGGGEVGRPRRPPPGRGGAPALGGVGPRRWRRPVPRCRGGPAGSGVGRCRGGQPARLRAAGAGRGQCAANRKSWAAA